MWGKERQGNLYDWITEELTRLCALLKVVMFPRGLKGGDSKVC